MGRISFSLKYWDARQTHGKSPNFGDELSGWLYRKLLEVPMHADAPAMLYGIGTILQVGSRPKHEPRPDCLKVVLGSGTGDGPCPDISQGWKVYFVRGPLSAQRLGLDPHCAIADPAILVRRFYQPAYSPRHPLGYMPHYWEDFYNGDALRKICANLGLHFISPREEIEKVLDEIASCDRLMTESLHGAIIADAFRIPWIPVETSHHFYRFKWRDWMASLGMSYPVCRIRRPGSILCHRNVLKTLEFSLVFAQMAVIARSQRGYLSSDTALTVAEERMLEAIADFYCDWRVGFLDELAAILAEGIPVSG